MIRNRTLMNAVPQWWILLLLAGLFHIGTRLSLMLFIAPGTSLGYMPIWMGFVAIQLWGPLVLIPLYLNAVFSAGLWDLPNWWFWPLYALPETLAVFLSWLFFSVAVRGRPWIPNKRELLKYLLLGCFIPVSLGSFLVQLQLIALGDLRWDQFLPASVGGWLSDLLGVVVFSLPVLILLRPVFVRLGVPGSEQAGLLLPEGLRTAKLRFWIEIGVLAGSLAVIAIFLPIQQSWYVWAGVILLVALRHGMGLVLVFNALVVLLSIFGPNYGLYLKPADTGQIEIVVTYLNMITICLAGLVVGRTSDDLKREVARRLTYESELRSLNAGLEERVEVRTSELSAANRQLSATIGDLHRTQEALIRKEKLASLGVLVAGIAHELDTPLGNAFTLITSLRERADLDRAIPLIENNLKRAVRLVETFRDLVESQNAGEPERFDLGHSIKGVLATKGDSLALLRAQVHTDIPEGTTLYNYRRPCERVVATVVDNALVHALPLAAEPMLWIRVRYVGRGESPHGEDQHTGGLEIEIKDNGPGINDTILRRIYDPFFTTKMASGSMGMGLPIAANLINNLMAGRIEIDPGFGTGATFRIVLPVVIEPQEV